jgi:hypothetical protein
MRKIYSLTFLILSFSCTPKPGSDALMDSLVGSYFYAYSSDGQISVEENCSIQTGTKFTIEKVNDVYLMHHQSIDTISYVVQKVDQNGSEILVDAYGDDIDGESENPTATKFRFLKGDLTTMTQNEQQFLLVLVESKNQYIFRTCEEAMLQETDTDSPVTAAIPEFDETTPEGQLLAEFFKLLDTQAPHPIYFSEGQTITLESPGPGVMPMVEKIENDAALKTFVQNRFNNYSPGILANWYNKDLFTMNGLEFKCEPQKAGVFIAITTDPVSKITSAEISLVDDDAGEPQTQFTLYYEWDENRALILSKIDVTDCSA